VVAGSNPVSPTRVYAVQSRFSARASKARATCVRSSRRILSLFSVCGSGSCLTFQFRLQLHGSGTRFREVRDNSSGRCFTPGSLQLVVVGSFVVVGGLRKGPACCGSWGCPRCVIGRCRRSWDGAVISGVARRYGVSLQTVHAWLRRYAREGAVLNLEDRSSRPRGCPHEMAPAVEARVLVLRDRNPRWGCWTTSQLRPDGA
jgi:leucine-zipper of insertion element IS481